MDELPRATNDPAPPAPLVAGGDRHRDRRRERRRRLAALVLTTGVLAVASVAAAEADTPSPVVDVRLTGATVETESLDVHEVGRVVTITAPGTYQLSGHLYNGRLVVDSLEPGEVTLILDGVSVYAATGPALVVEAAEHVALYLPDGSYNNLFDGLERLDGEAGSAVHSEAPLLVRGEGHLLVHASLKHGIESERELVIDGGVLTVIAADDGIRGENLTVNGGDVLVFAANDALKSTGEDEGTGVVELNAGSIDLVAIGDGVQAERVLLVRGGEIDVLSGGGHTVTPNDDSTKGLKADVELIIEGGTIRVDSSDDAVHSDGDIRIRGGHLTLATGDDAVHADGSLDVSDGWVEVTASWEGLEAPWLTISGGTVIVAADDDALNAAGDAPSSELLLLVSGGHVVTTAGSDAMDSNGSVHVTGGTVVLDGPYPYIKPAIDRHFAHTVLLDGGTIVAGGWLASQPHDAIDVDSTQGVVFLDFHWLVQAGTVITVRGESGDVATFRAPRTLAFMSFTAPDIEPGEAYEVWLGGAPVGVELPGGLFEPAGTDEAVYRRTFEAR